MFSLRRPEVSDLIPLMKAIIHSVKDDQIAILPNDKDLLLLQIDSMLNSAKQSDDLSRETLQEGLSLLQHISVAVNLDRYVYFSHCVTRASTLIDALLNQDDTSDQREHQSLAQLTEYLIHHSIIDDIHTLKSGNRAKVVKAYQTHILSFTEAVDAIKALMACHQKLQLSQLSTLAARPLAA